MREIFSGLSRFLTWALTCRLCRFPSLWLWSASPHLRRRGGRSHFRLTLMRARACECAGEGRERQRRPMSHRDTWPDNLWTTANVTGYTPRVRLWEPLRSVLSESGATMTTEITQILLRRLCGVRPFLFCSDCPSNNLIASLFLLLHCDLNSRERLPVAYQPLRMPWVQMWSLADSPQNWQREGSFKLPRCCFTKSDKLAAAFFHAAAASSWGKTLAESPFLSSEGTVGRLWHWEIMGFNPRTNLYQIV